MFGLGFSLAIGGGREAVARLAAIAGGVAVGAALLLFTVAGFTALHLQDVHDGWLYTGSHNVEPSVNHVTTDPLLWQYTEDEFEGQTINRVNVAATGAHSPVPPALPKLPSPGQYYASPALARLIADTPTNELANRFPGTLAGTISKQGLDSPDELAIVVGYKPSVLATFPQVQTVRSIELAPRQHSLSTFLKVVLLIGATGLLFPILIFVGISSRLSAARREQRFAALRLVGATPKQVNGMASIEALVAACVGVVIGFILFFALRPAIARISFATTPFYASDLTTQWYVALGIAVGIPILSALGSIVALRRVQISPLGAARHVTPKPPRFWRVLPLLFGLSEVALLVTRPRADLAQAVVVIGLLSGFLLTMVGLILGGPWVMMVFSRLLAKRAESVAGLISARHMADNPKASFRAISGIILAVFVASVFSNIVYTALKVHTVSSSPLPQSAMADSFNSSSTTQLDPNQGLNSSAAASLTRKLTTIPGVQTVVPIYTLPAGVSTGQAVGIRQKEGGSSNVEIPDGAIRCTDIALLNLGGCAQASGYTAIPVRVILSGNTPTVTTWQSLASATNITNQPVAALIVLNNGNTSTIEQVRTTFETTSPLSGTPQTQQELVAGRRSTLIELQRAADIGVIITLAIAGCSLTVSVLGGLLERKRPLTLLRLTGLQLRDVRKVIIYEAVVPLVIVAIVSAGIGLLFADLIVRLTLVKSLSRPAPGYYELLAAGIIIAIGTICATLPALNGITDPDNARFE